MGDAARWPELAAYNMIHRPDRIFVGQTLILPYDLRAASHYSPISHHHQQLDAGPPPNYWERQTPLVPAWAHVFVIADEFNPLRRKLVRKVVRPKEALSPGEIERILRPEKFGITPRYPASSVLIGRHVLGRVDSRYISASENFLGAERFPGTRYWIDTQKATAAGAIIHEGSEIATDLDRILLKRKSTPTFREYIEDIRKKSLIQDREVLIEGHIPAAAIEGGVAKALTHSLQIVEGIGIVFSAYDGNKARQLSIKSHSFVPLARESTRQVGGWGGATIGARIGGVAGTALGIEMGPGALITGAIGSFIGGAVGYFGANWAAEKIGANQ